MNFFPLFIHSDHSSEFCLFFIVLFYKHLNTIRNLSKFKNYEITTRKGLQANNLPDILCDQVLSTNIFWNSLRMIKRKTFTSASRFTWMIFKLAKQLIMFNTKKYPYSAYDTGQFHWFYFHSPFIRMKIVIHATSSEKWYLLSLDVTSLINEKCYVRLDLGTLQKLVHYAYVYQ